MGEGGGGEAPLFRYQLSPFPQKRLILRLYLRGPLGYQLLILPCATRGGSRGRVQGVRTPPPPLRQEDKTRQDNFFYLESYTILSISTLSKQFKIITQIAH